MVLSLCKWRLQSLLKIKGETFAKFLSKKCKIFQRRFKKNRQRLEMLELIWSKEKKSWMRTLKQWLKLLNELIMKIEIWSRKTLSLTLSLNHKKEIENYFLNRSFNRKSKMHLQKKHLRRQNESLMKLQRKLKRIKSLMMTLIKLRNRNQNNELLLPKILESKLHRVEDHSLNLSTFSPNMVKML